MIDEHGFHVRKQGDRDPRDCLAMNGGPPAGHYPGGAPNRDRFKMWSCECPWCPVIQRVDQRFWRSLPFRSSPVSAFGLGLDQKTGAEEE